MTRQLDHQRLADTQVACRFADVEIVQSEDVAAAPQMEAAYGGDVADGGVAVLCDQHRDVGSRQQLAPAVRGDSDVFGLVLVGRDLEVHLEDQPGVGRLGFADSKLGSHVGIPLSQSF